ncbi:unnamed protein product [Candidula unifasciata]|uniref:Coatomer subunit beta' n=1 Tax=Candidula unifasciata TaxID=100452 RepID=A0A8S3ZCF3_9EUPU|nr:unnamed protein product [Candidula unifasciata]
MPLKLKVKRRLLARSERVKSIELHPSEPWMLVGLYSGRVYIWNIDTKQILKTLDVSDLPVRAARFVSRKNWVITGSDDTCLRVFNYNTLEYVTQFSAHVDFIRSVAVHPSSPFVLTAGDDGVIKLWDWEKKWACSQVFKGHTFCIMQIVFNPKDNNQFATASLDRSVKVWQFGSSTPNFSLKHERDVNCLDYHPGGDKPYIVSGEDGGTIRIWDYQTKSCVQSLQVHTKDVNDVVFHPSLPVILSGSADGTVRIIHSNTFRLENTLNYGLERVWTISCHRGTNNVAIGFDEGSMIIRLGQEEPAISMDSSGKIIWARHSEIQQANIKAIADQEIKDGERLSLAVKDMGSCEIYPQTIAHGPNGRFVAVCGDGEYIIYTAMALRSKSYGTGQEFVWGPDSSTFAVRDDGSTLKVFKNFKEHKQFKPPFGAEGIFGGHLLGVKSFNSFAFYDWESMKLIRRIEISPKKVFWSENGHLVCMTSEDTLYMLKYNSELAEQATEFSEYGIDDSFEVVKEVKGTVQTGMWIGDCFVFTSSINRLNYCVGGEIVTVAHLDREMYVLGYIPKDNRLYLCDKELNIISYSLLVSVLDYQTAVMRQDFDSADKILPVVPTEQRTRVAMFLEKQGFRPQALAVTTDLDHKFDLAIQLGDLKTAYSIARQHDLSDKWKQLAVLAIKSSEFSLAQECMFQSKDFGGLLLLATSSGHGHVMAKLAQEASDAGQNNVAFVANFVMGRCEECLEILIKSKRLPEAALFARTYLPSQTSRVVTEWKSYTATFSKKLSSAIADPTEYQNLFHGHQEALRTEQFLKQQRLNALPAAAYSVTATSSERNTVQEMLQAEKSGTYVYKEPVLSDTAEILDDDSSESDGFVKVYNNPGAEREDIQESASHSDFSQAMSSLTMDPENANRILSKKIAENKDSLESTKIDSIDLERVVLKYQVETDLEKELQAVLDDVDLDDFDLADVDLDMDELLDA